MKLRFLCSNHRNWLVSDSEAAQGATGPGDDLPGEDVSGKLA